jgi:hypothetical protein
MILACICTLDLVLEIDRRQRRNTLVASMGRMLPIILSRSAAVSLTKRSVSSGEHAQLAGFNFPLEICEKHQQADQDRLRRVWRLG